MMHWAFTYVSFRGNEGAMVPHIKMLAERAARYTTAAVVVAHNSGLSSANGDMSAVPSGTGAGADYSTYQDLHMQGMSGELGGGRDGDGSDEEEEDENWYIDEFGRRVPRADSDLSRYETFYCSVQTACYCLCFYGLPMAQVTLISNPRQPQLRHHWETVLTCAYNPLKYCLHSVRQEFIHIVQAVDISLLSTIDNAVGRGGLRALLAHSSSTSVSAAPSTAGVNPLDTFFPFDPCLLSRVHEYIQEGYRSWTGAPPGLTPTTSSASEEALVAALSGRVIDESDSDAEAEEEEGDDTVSSVVSSMASSIASMALLAHGGGEMGGSYMESSVMAMSYGTPGAAGASELLSVAYAYGGTSIHRDRGVSIGSNASGAHVGASVHSNSSSVVGEGGGDEDQWGSILRMKRSRQYSVGSAGSW
jgi:hypothetical protein